MPRNPTYETQVPSLRTQVLRTQSQEPKPSGPQDGNPSLPGPLRTRVLSKGGAGFQDPGPEPRLKNPWGAQDPGPEQGEPRRTQFRSKASQVRSGPRS